MKYGIFGGSFDPMHLEHIKIIQNAYKQLGLDKVIIVPSFNPPHKSKLYESFDNRLEMINLGILHYAWAIIDNVEERLGLNNSYTYLVIEELTKKYGRPYALIVGGDSLANFHEWKNPEIILKQTNLAVFSRKGYPDILETAQKIKNSYGCNIYTFDNDLEDISSSEIRAMIMTGISRKELFLHEKISKYIEDKGLYKCFDYIVKKLKDSISERLFLHSAETAVYAVRLASKNNINYEKAFLSGLLHDCAKEDNYDASLYPNILPQIVHQYESAKKAKNYFGIMDDEILNSIKYHTTGAPNMSDLSKIVFLADKLESRRQYSNVSTCRDLADRDLHQGFLTVLTNGYNYTKNRSLDMDKLTLETILWYNNCKD
jgi:nicotinate-nucleotide adenylyltransferase